MTVAALAVDMTTPIPVAPRTLSITSDLFGVVTVPADSVLHFPNGLLGFPECREFILLPAEREHLYWLQSVAHPTLVLLLIDPFVFFPGYTVDLATSDIGRMATSPNEVMVLSIVTLPSARGGSPTANLQGPVVINTTANHAYQVVLPDGHHGIREIVNL